MSMVHQITVVLEHPLYCDLSSIILQEEFEKYHDALLCYRDLCDMYTEGHYAVVYDSDREFSLSKYNDLLQEMRKNQPWSSVR